ncbi:MAG: hypothetical protein ACRD0V_22480 [Acidimicrobiales bacterium]
MGTRFVDACRLDVGGLGTIANHAMAAITEDAKQRPLEGPLAQVRGVIAVLTMAYGPIPPETSATSVVETEGRSNRLTLLATLVKPPTPLPASTHRTSAGEDSRSDHRL